MRIRCVLCVFILCLNTSWAEPYRHLGERDNRIKFYTYSADRIYPIMGSAFISTQVILRKHEKIVDMQCGDADAWTFNINKSVPYIFNIKPTVPKSSTDLSVTSINSHGQFVHYYFQITANDSKMIEHSYVINFNSSNKRFISPRHATNIVVDQSIHKNRYHWDYSFSGDKTLVPKHVFDDGKFTYFQLRSDQKIPAIFKVVSSNGDEALVNFRKQGPYIIVLETSPQFTLRAGTNHVTSIFNQRLTRKAIHAL
jgi:type IV secretion system protein VirB9